jgi:cytochrome c oxidase assembly protein subunit 15
MTTANPIHRYTQATIAFAAFVIFAGAMVTSTGSGMSVPDWPQSFGTWTPKMVGGVFYEHGHRVVAGALALLVLGLALWAAGVEKRLWARALTWGALVAVIAQALLGGLTVLLGTYNGWDHTHPVFTVLHATLAQALFAALVAYATVSAPGWGQAGRRPGSPARARQAEALVALAFVQIVLGAAMRHQHAGLIISDFPLSYGRVIPEFYNGLVALNFSHRVGGWLLAGLGSALAVAVWRDPAADAWVKAPAKVLLAAVLLQFLLGACVVWTHLTEPVLTSCHVVGGSVVFTSLVVLALRLRRLAGGA